MLNTDWARSRMQLSIEIPLDVALRYDEQNDIHVSWCPSLNIYSQGTTEEGATEALRSALVMFLQHAYERGVVTYDASHD